MNETQIQDSSFVSESIFLKQMGGKMPDIPDTKTCPVCKKVFTRKQLLLSAGQWFTRVYCGRKCYFKGRRDTR